jgi:hypothetical protein
MAPVAALAGAGTLSGTGTLTGPGALASTATPTGTGTVAGTAGPLRGARLPSLGRAVPLSPRLAACCEIAMGVTMGYMLIVLL